MAGYHFLRESVGLPGRRKPHGAEATPDSASADRICDDILRLVLRVALAPPATSIGEWKRGLAFLAVCRRWRAVALPLVYSRIFVLHHGSGHVGRGGMLMRHIGRWRRQPKCATNASLAMAGGYTRLAKSVIISAHETIPLAAFIRGVAGALRLQTIPWPGVRSAVFQFGPGVVDGTGRELADPKVFVTTFAKNMRNVISLDIRGIGQHDGPQCDLPGMLVDAYSRQLARLSADVNLSLQAARFSSHLTCLQLSMKPLSIQGLPMIDPAPLRHLSLFDVVANFEWNIFASTGADGQVVFPNLYKLSIRYSTAGGRTDAAAADDGGCMGVRLRFPVLKRLHVFQCPQNCVLLSKAIYPPKLHRAVIECASGTGTLEKISGLVPSRELTVIMTHMDSDDMGSYYRAANKGFGSGAIADRLSLVLRTRRAVPDPARINWTHLAALNVHTNITTTTLLGLLAKMPNLDRLSATHLISSHRSDEFRVSHHHPSKDGQLRPMLPQARHVALRFVAELSLHHRDAGFVLYLITGMTALKSLSTTPTMQARLAKLVAKHASEHPHLQQIRLAATA